MPDRKAIELCEFFTNYRHIANVCQVWRAATQVQGELITKARMVVPTAYGLQGDLMRGNGLFDVLKWLIQQGKLIHSGIDTKVSSYPFSRHAIQTVHDPGDDL